MADALSAEGSMVASEAVWLLEFFCLFCAPNCPALPHCYLAATDQAMYKFVHRKHGFSQIAELKPSLTSSHLPGLHGMEGYPKAVR